VSIPRYRLLTRHVRSYTPSGISMVTGSAAAATPELTPTQQSNYVSPSVTANSFPSTTSAIPNAATTTPPQTYDTYVTPIEAFYDS